MFWKYSWAHVFELKNCFSQVKPAFGEEVAFIQPNAASIIRFLPDFLSV